MENAKTEYKLVRGLMRGLDLLSALNHHAGRASINQLAQETGLHRTTVRRLLETLQHAGYVERNQSDERLYQLTWRVRLLSDGFRDEHWISSLAAPLLEELRHKVLWPTDLCTLDVDAMLIRETTHRFSRLSFHSQMVGRRLPMFITAAGKAYIAHCPDKEREQIIELIKHHDDESGTIARNPERVRAIIEQTRASGYGSNYAEWSAEKKFAGIALPIIASEQVIGCLNLVYLAKAMRPEEAARRYLPDMQATVEQIAAGWNKLLASQKDLLEPAQPEPPKPIK